MRKILIIILFCILNENYLHAADAYASLKTNIGHINDSLGLDIDFSIGGSWFNNAIIFSSNFIFCPGLGYIYNKENENEDNDFYLNMVCMGVETGYTLFPNWPVNLTFTINGNFGWIGKRSEFDKGADLDDFIMLFDQNLFLNIA